MPYARAQPSALPILCLEDDAHFGVALKRALAGRDVDLVCRADQSRERMQGTTYAAWLLDVNVPDGSGLEVLAWARARGDDTPALVMTGGDDRSVPNRAQALGAEFLYKPCTKSNIEAFLERSEQRESSRRELAEAERASLARAVTRLAEEFQLPARERDIVEALSRGVARADLAASLDLKENTLKSMVRRLLVRTAHENLDELLRSLLRSAQ